MAAWEMKGVLTDLEYEQCIERGFNGLIESKDHYVRCPQCTAPFEVMGAQEDGSEGGEAKQGDAGVVVGAAAGASQRANDDASKYRVRCPRCPTPVIFCCKCLANPFHTGLSCAQHHRYVSGAKCRYVE